MTIQELIDKRRAAEAVLYGLNMQIAYALGQHEDAHHWKTLMNAATTARIAARESGCYFDSKGAEDAAQLSA